MSTVGSPGGPGSVAPCQPSSSVESSGYLEPLPDRGLLAVTRSPMLARRLAPLRACGGHMGPARRRKREMIPADKKDAAYWDKRRKNNEAAKRSREKRRLNDLLLEGQLLALSEENAQLRAQVLDLHCHTSLNADKRAPPCHFAPSPVLASALLLSSVPPHTPALFQAGLWGASGSGSAALMGVGQQDATMRPFESKVPWFSPSRGAFNPPGHCARATQQGSAPLSRPRVLSHGGPPGVERSAEAEMDPVSSSDDISAGAPPQPLSFLPTFLPTLDAFPHGPIGPRAPQSWVVSHLNHPAMCDKLAPWRPPCLAPQAVYPGPYWQMQENQGPGAGAEERSHKEPRSRFSSAS